MRRVVAESQFFQPKHPKRRLALLSPSTTSLRRSPFCVKNKLSLANYSTQNSSSFKMPIATTTTSNNNNNNNSSSRHQQLTNCKHSTAPNNSINSRRRGGKGTICIEGNIGCGKTTLLDFFKSQKYGAVCAEPVECWRNVDGENLFQHLYKDPRRFSLAFQTYVQLTMIKLHKRLPTLMERSIYSARYCFVENLYRLGYLSRVEFVILHSWFKYLVCGDSTALTDATTATATTQTAATNVNDDDEDEIVDAAEFELLSKPTAINIDMIIYLRCSPQNAFARVKSRNRSEEKNVTFDYIQSLHTLHEDWLVRAKFPVPAPVLILDTDCSLESLELLYEKAASYISGERKLDALPTVISLNEN